jgi:manganese/zinc/iron transport system permease protein
VALSAALGAGAGLVGALASSAVPKLPTGPTIVLTISGVAIVSFLLAPNRGLIWRQVRDLRRRRTLALDAVLLDLRQLAVQHADPTHPHNVSALESVERVGGVRASLAALAARGFVRQTAHDRWSLTPHGLAEARRLDAERGGGLS